MTFKYLYCCHDKHKYNDYFKYCHMPLDSFTLEWLKRNLVKADNSRIIKTDGMAPWSNLEYGNADPDYFTKDGKQYYSYNFYVQKFQAYIDANECIKDYSPLEVEFVIWPEIRLETAMESFYFAWNDDISQKEKNDFRKETYATKKNKIKDLFFNE